MSDTLFLSRPDVAYKASYIAAMREFEAEGRPPQWNFGMLEAHFDEWVAQRLSYETDPLPGYVPQSDYWLIAEGQYAGEISLRHHLNEALERYGGHIGYHVRPGMRRRGYGTQQLCLMLDIAKQRGYSRVLITCDDDNIGSYKIIEACGGVLQDKIDNGRPALTRRYWIILSD